MPVAYSVRLRFTSFHSLYNLPLSLHHPTSVFFHFFPMIRFRSKSFADCAVLIAVLLSARRCNGAIKHNKALYLLRQVLLYIYMCVCVCVYIHSGT